MVDGDNASSLLKQFDLHILHRLLPPQYRQKLKIF